MATLMRCTIALIVIAVSACGLTTSALGVARSTTSTASRSDSNSAVTSSSDADAAPAAGMLAVPNMIGKTADEARALARAAGFAMEVESSPAVSCDHEPHDDGKISCQDPTPGARVSRYAMIQVKVYMPQEHPGTLVRDQIEALRGLTPDQAKQRLREIGHTGKVIIGEVLRFDPKCGQDTVCGTDHDGGMKVDADLELHLNPKLKLSAPPP